MRKIIHDGVAVITCTHNLCFRAKKNTDFFSFLFLVFTT